MSLKYSPATSIVTMIHAVLALGLVCPYFASAFLGEIPARMCPELEAQRDFNKHEFQGQWFTQGAWRGVPYWSDEKCSIYYFKLVNENHMIMKKGGYYPPSETAYTISMYVQNVDSTNPACWEILKQIGGDPLGDFRILDTDYRNYALVYGCMFEPVARIPYVWVMSRTAFPEESLIVEAVKAARRFGYRRTDFVRMDRSTDNCTEKLSRRGGRRGGEP